MTITDELLMAYADGELDGDDRAEVEAAAAADPEVARKIESHRALRAQLSAAFDPTLAERVPDHLVATARAKTKPNANILDFAAKRVRKLGASGGPRQWGAIAAGLAAGLVLGVGLTSMRQPLIGQSADGIIARGSLASALNQQAAADTGATIHIGLTFQNKDGDYCRTFTSPKNNLAGLACRDSSKWSVAMAVGESRAANSDFRQAASETPPEVLNAVEAMIAGDVFDAAREKQALDKKWARDTN